MAFPNTISLHPCRPPIWARGGHLQTILGHMLPSSFFSQKLEPFEVEVNGGDKVSIHLYRGDINKVAYFFHGLGGSSDSAYMHRSAEIAHQLGYSVILFNHRGCGTGTGLALEPYHSGRAEDLSAVIKFGREKFPNAFHAAVGFSLSGNALLLLCAQQRGMVLPDFAVSVNAPVNLQHSAERLRHGLNRLYDYRFMQDMKVALKTRALISGETNTLKIPFNMTVFDFDEMYTAPKGGFKNRDDYYQTCSAKNHWTSIKVETVALTAFDDPFVPIADYLALPKNPRVTFYCERYGGHMGYVSKDSLSVGKYRWLDYALKTLLNSAIARAC